MKRLLMTAAVSLLAVSSAIAKEAPKPTIQDVLGAVQTQLQQEGWWQMIPNGADPNDATYQLFLQDVVLALVQQAPKGSLRQLIQSLENAQ